MWYESLRLQTGGKMCLRIHTEILWYRLVERLRSRRTSDLRDKLGGGSFFL